MQKWNSIQELTNYYNNMAENNANYYLT